MPCPAGHPRKGHIRDYSLGVDVSDDEATDLPIPDKTTLEVHEKKKNLHILQEVARFKFFPDQDEMIHHRGNKAFITRLHSDTTTRTKLIARGRFFWIS